MRYFITGAFMMAASLFANHAPFASQSDLVADLSDAMLNNFYAKHDPCNCTIWAEGFGNYRSRSYEDYFGGVLIGVNRPICCDSSVDFFVGGSGGEISFDNDDPSFDTWSVVLGTSWQKVCCDRYFGFAFIVGYLNEHRTTFVHEEPRGLYLTPELAYSREFDCMSLPSIFTCNLRYAGFFSRDYQHRETLGTVNIQKRSVQLFTLRGDWAIPIRGRCFECAPYIGAAGRFQFDGNHVNGRQLQEHIEFSDGIDNVIGYGLIGVRCNKQCGSFDWQLSLEYSYDSDDSSRVLGNLALSYAY